MGKIPKSKPIKVGYVLAYKAPDYIRTKTLLNGLKSNSELRVYTAINTKTGVLLYFQTLWKLLKLRLTKNPDVYILGFRGHEIFLPVKLLTIGKPLIFDEFIVMSDWVSSEHGILDKDSFAFKVVLWYQKLILNMSSIILSDTEPHAELSSKLHNIHPDKYKTVYVSSDEDVFYPAKKQSKHKKFTVFYYGTGLPLHGFEYVLGAAKELSKESNIQLEIVGGKGKQKILNQINQLIKDNNLKNVKHYEWLPFNDLADHVRRSDVCLGGPFGGTGQANRVITGKTFQFLSAKKPVIVGKTEIKKVFKDKKNAIVVNQSSPKDIAKAIMWAYKNQTKLNDIAKAGHETYRNEFSNQKIGEDIREAIKMATGK